MIRVDTNYIIRYPINDNIEMADIAEEILTTKSVFISNEIHLLRSSSFVTLLLELK